MKTSKPQMREVNLWLKRIVKRLSVKVHPDKIILFGSYAYGRPHKDSDVDLFVVLSRPTDRDKRYEMVDKAIGEHLWPLDILVRDPAEIASRLRMGDPFVKDILSRGKVLYES